MNRIKASALVKITVNSAADRLTTEIVSSVEGVRALRPDYERLYGVAANLLPFARHEWHVSWCEHFLRGGTLTRRQPLFCLVRRASGDCVAVFPLLLTTWGGGALRIVTLSLIGGDAAVTEIRDPLVEPGCERASVLALYEALARVPQWDWIQWNGISAALAEAVGQASAVQWHEVRDDYLLDLPATWEEFRRGLKRNIRESLRHCYNSLRRDGHEFQFEVARERDAVRAALPRFLELHGMRAGMSFGTRHPHRFATPQRQAFLYSVCEQMAASDCVRLFQLRIGEQVVAARLGFALGDSIYMYYSGFDPAWARYSVMTTTLVEAMKYSIEQGVRTINLSPTAERSKLRWRPRLVMFHSAVVRRESLSSRTKYRAWQAMRSAAGSRFGTRLREIFRPGLNS